MKKPIWDFVRTYAESDIMRLHMPGHKGVPELGMEAYDITEIQGADSLFEADGIIAESEANAALLFGSKATFYSTEGSSLCIRAMLYLALLDAKKRGISPRILAGRNVHKTFVSACGMLGIDVEWIYPDEEETYLSCTLDAAKLHDVLSKIDTKPTALYVTSPDYLGRQCDLAALAEICHRHEMLLLVDNAHGAYLHFLPEPAHPMDLGADMCCDSAHKTLPVLTGGAYLHISKRIDDTTVEQASGALAIFASTSPSYLILSSLDACNTYLSDGYRALLSSYSDRIATLKVKLNEHGYRLVENEPLKITFDVKAYGYCGEEFADLLRESNCECEFADRDYTVLMLTPGIGEDELVRLEQCLYDIPKKCAINERAPKICRRLESMMPMRDAMLTARERVSLDAAAGRILASVHVGCPPAVPIAICGERLTDEAVEVMRYYRIREVDVVIE